MNVRSYLVSVCSLVVLTEIVRLIVPKGKTKRTAEIVFSLVTVITLITPLVNLKNVLSGNSWSEIAYEDNGYGIEEVTEKYYERIASNALNDDDIPVENIAVKTENGEIKKITIYLSDLVIDEKKEHINSSEIRTRLSTLFQIDTEVIEVFER